MRPLRLLLASCLLLTSSTTFGAIIYSGDLNGGAGLTFFGPMDSSLPGGRVYIDLDSMSALVGPRPPLPISDISVIPGADLSVGPGAIGYDGNLFDYSAAAMVAHHEGDLISDFDPFMTTAWWYPIGGFNESPWSYYGYWEANKHAYLGFKTTVGNFGWIGIQYIDPWNGTVTGFAYEDTGAPIVAGAKPPTSPTNVPDSSSTVALFGLAIAPMVWLARRRAA